MFASRSFERHALATDAGRLHVLVQEPRQAGASANPPCAFIVGTPSDGCLVRIHSRCLYGDVIGSRECDCGLQLTHAMAMIRSAGAGVLVYLDQEGRGAGLFPKARAYRRREEQDIDSFASYEHDRLRADMRTYDDAIAILCELGLQCVTLLTNNWEKVAALRDAGIKVERRGLVVPFASEAEPYMRSKYERGHDLDDAFPAARGDGRASWWRRRTRHSPMTRRPPVPS